MSRAGGAGTSRDPSEEVPAEAARRTSPLLVPWLCDPALRRVCPCLALRLDDNYYFGRVTAAL